MRKVVLLYVTIATVLAVSCEPRRSTQEPIPTVEPEPESVPRPTLPPPDIIVLGALEGSFTEPEAQERLEVLAVVSASDKRRTESSPVARARLETTADAIRIDSVTDGSTVAEVQVTAIPYDESEQALLEGFAVAIDSPSSSVIASDINDSGTMEVFLMTKAGLGAEMSVYGMWEGSFAQLLPEARPFGTLTELRLINDSETFSFAYTLVAPDGVVWDAVFRWTELGFEMERTR